MDSPKLSERLNTIFQALTPGYPLWDVCCDHGYLGLAAYLSGQFPEIFFVDRVEEIITDLNLRFHQKYFSANNPTRYEFLPLNGGEIGRPVSGNLVIAGVGSPTIENILKSLNSNGFLKANHLILCPQNHPLVFLEKMQEDLKSNYELRAHQIVFEKTRHRHIFVFDCIN